MIYLLTAIGLSPGGSSTVHICTQTIHRTSQKFWKYVGRAPFGELYPGLTTEKKARKNLEARKILRLNHTIKLCNIYCLSTQMFCTHAPKWNVICTLNKLLPVRVRGRWRYKMFWTEFYHTFPACNLLCFVNVNRTFYSGPEYLKLYV